MNGVADWPDLRWNMAERGLEMGRSSEMAKVVGITVVGRRLNKVW